MSKNEHSIHIPDEAEVAQFGGVPAGKNGPEAQNPAGEAAASPESASSNDVQKQVEEWKDRCLRAKAELQNVQRRNAAERADLIRYANADFARSLLNVLTDIERTIAAAQKSANCGALLDGVILVRDNFLKVLSQFGIEPIDALNSPFDPNQHEALMQQPSPVHAPGTVIQEYERGFKLHDRVLRPARVIVASAPGSEAEAVSGSGHAAS